MSFLAHELHLLVKAGVVGVIRTTRAIVCAELFTAARFDYGHRQVVQEALPQMHFVAVSLLSEVFALHLGNDSRRSVLLLSHQLALCKRWHLDQPDCVKVVPHHQSANA